MTDLTRAIVDNGVAIGLIIVFVIGVFYPPKWIKSLLDRRTKAYEDSQNRIAESIERIEVNQQTAFADFLTSIRTIQQAQTEFIELRKQDNDRLAMIVGEFKESVGNTTRAVNICERLASRIEPRKDQWNPVERSLAKSAVDRYRIENADKESRIEGKDGT